MSFFEKIAAIQKNLNSYLATEELPKRAMEMVRDFMEADNALLTLTDGKYPKYWVRNEGWVPKSYSFTVVKNAISSEEGFSVSSIEDSPSESQISGNILSCTAAKVGAGERVIGALYCDIRNGTKRYTEEDGRSLKLLADWLTCCLEYFELYERSLLHKDGKQHYYPRVQIGDLIGESPSIRRLKQVIEKVALQRTSVVITGESGTGKEVIAQLIHGFSYRHNRQFVPVVCAAIPKDLLESELFGHERGAFSNAYVKRSGLILAADGGTLFLDEVGDMSVEVQAKLLRVLDTKMIRHVGSDVEIGPVDFRLICATNKNLKEMVRAGSFREDLYYRICGRHLHLPPLRERLQDIPLLAKYFANPKTLQPEALKMLQELEWNGNVRELKHFIENVQDLIEGNEISVEAIQEELEYGGISRKAQNTETKQISDVDDFYDLKRLWDKRQIIASDLESRLNSLYQESNSNLNEVGRRLGLFGPMHLKRFRNWIEYLESSGIIHIG